MATSRRNPFVGSNVMEHIRELRARSPRVAALMDEERAKLEVAAKVRALRLKQKMTQAELAKRAGLKQPVVARVESGRQFVNVQTLERLARAMGKKLDVRFIAQVPAAAH